MKRAATKRMKPVRAWAVMYRGRVLAYLDHFIIAPTREKAHRYVQPDEQIVRVEIREVAARRKSPKDL